MGVLRTKLRGKGDVAFLTFVTFGLFALIRAMILTKLGD